MSERKQHKSLTLIYINVNDELVLPQTPRNPLSQSNDFAVSVWIAHSAKGNEYK